MANHAGSNSENLRKFHLKSDIMIVGKRVPFSAIDAQDESGFSDANYRINRAWKRKKRK